MYNPSTPPSEYSPQFMATELRKLSEAINRPVTSSVNLVPVYVAPDKPREGDIINAAGALATTLGAAGLYHFLSGSYTKL